MIKKEEFDSENNGIPFKTIIKMKDDGKIIDVMDRPNKKLVSKDLHTSGLHIFADRPEENHYDHFKGNKKWIERGTKEKPLKFPIEISETKESILI